MYKLQERKLPKGTFTQFFGMFPNVQNSRLQVDADSETSVHTNTQQNLLMKRTNQHRLLSTFHRMVNDRCQSDDKTQYQVKRHHLAKKYVLKKKIWESFRLDLKISEIQKLQHSRKYLSNGLLSMEETNHGKQLGFCARRVFKFQVRILRNETGSSNHVPRAMFLHLPHLRRILIQVHRGLGSIISYDE